MQVNTVQGKTAMIRTSEFPVGRRRMIEKTKRMKFLPGQMILRVREEAVTAVAGAQAMRMTASHAKRLPESISELVGYLERNAGLKSINPLFSKRRMALGRASVSRKDRQRLAALTAVRDAPHRNLSGLTMLQLDPKCITPSLMKTMRQSRGIEYVEPTPARWLAASADPNINLQWGLRAIDWFRARRPGAGFVNVAVLDTGIDHKHPDLQSSVYEYHHPGLSGRDLLGHGTHVAGIIAAIVNNGVGIAGVADCFIEAWKIFDDRPASDGEFYVNMDRYLQALEEVRVSDDVWVVNLSLGGTASSRTEALLFRMLEEADKVVVAAMGNEHEEGNPTEYPAAYDSVLAIGSVNEALRRSRFSNTGDHIDVVAPGSNILSTLPTRTSDYLDETDYASWSGTSMATPHVAGAVALILAKHSDWSAERVKNRLRRTAARVPSMRAKGKSSAYGWGLINLKKALA